MSDGEPPRNEERRSDLAVMDAQEYKQKRRLERILDAHDHVEEAASESFEAYAYGEIDEHAKNIVLLQAVKKYIREVYQLLRKHEYEEWQSAKEAAEEEDEQVDVTDLNSYLFREGEDPLGRIETEQGDDIVFQGLADVLAADTTYTETWEERVPARHGAGETKEHRVQHTVPEEVSWNAYLVTTEFLTEEHDLELQFEELDDSLPTWGFEEVPDEEGTEVHSDAYDPEKDYGPSTPTEVADGDD